MLWFSCQHFQPLLHKFQHPLMLESHVWYIKSLVVDNVTTLFFFISTNPLLFLWPPPLVLIGFQLMEIMVLRVACHPWLIENTAVALTDMIFHKKEPTRKPQVCLRPSVICRTMLSSEFGRRRRVQSHARRWLQLIGCAALLMDASNFGGPDRVGESRAEPRRSLRKTRAS